MSPGSTARRRIVFASASYDCPDGSAKFGAAGGVQEPDQRLLGVDGERQGVGRRGLVEVLDDARGRGAPAGRPQRERGVITFGVEAQAVVARVVTESPRPMIPQRHTIPPHIEAAVNRCLEKLREHLERIRAPGEAS